MSEHDTNYLMKLFDGIDDNFTKNTAQEMLRRYNQVLQENQQLKEQLDISNANYDIIYDYFRQISELLDSDTCEDMLDKINNLQQQLKQRDEVIGEAIEFINHTQYDPELRSHVCGINFGGTMKLLEILQRYRGDNK